MHKTVIDGSVLSPEEGLLIGNGDLSVSLYQKPGYLVWRFGKPDVWDRRLDSDANPKPAHISEVANGILEEGWACPPYGGPVEATHGTNNPERMRQICQPTPSEMKPYPCPKPVGELSLRLPPDLKDLHLSQTLIIEEGRIEVVCSWRDGSKLELDCYVHPEFDVLLVDWRFTGFNADMLMPVFAPETFIKPFSPLLFSLYRWKDSEYCAFDDLFLASTGDYLFRRNMENEDLLSPLDPPTVRSDEGHLFVEQRFAPDALFPDGFCCRMVPYITDGAISHLPMEHVGEAHIDAIPSSGSLQSGTMAVHIVTNLSEGGLDGAMRHVRRLIGDNPVRIPAGWRRDVTEAGKRFWSQSSVSISDRLLENVWYETLHAQRCIYGKCKIPPGLMMPSSIPDYVKWHGDYHSNYNFQQPFFGVYTSGHPELADSYYRGVDFFVEIGRKIARDYYGCRGVFIQLTAYPMKLSDDILGCCPMGRMAYMTGWIMHHHWWHYLYTLDKEFLRERGYPLIRDCALFYADFLSKGDDGFFHAFPSNIGEDGFSGNPDEYRDRSQLMREIRYTLRTAISAAGELGMDGEFVELWNSRLANLAPDNPMDSAKFNSLEVCKNPLNPPEFGVTHVSSESVDNFRPFADRAHHCWSWYFGKLPLAMMALLRTRRFDAERDFADFRGIIERWRDPNGLFPAMAVAGYGHTGGWCESLGVTAPLQEMMLQSWEGAIRLFPAWPKKVDACFTGLWAEGAFSVSAEHANGELRSASITSKAGAACRLYAPWKSTAVIRMDTDVPVRAKTDGNIISWETEPQAGYRLQKV